MEPLSSIISRYRDVSSRNEDHKLIKYLGFWSYRILLNSAVDQKTLVVKNRPREQWEARFMACQIICWEVGKLLGCLRTSKSEDVR